MSLLRLSNPYLKFCNLLLSVSGGRTSEYMAQLLYHSHKGHVVSVFANTGCEEEPTYEFVQECSDRWKLNTIWVESVFDSRKGVGTTHRIVDFKSASRKGEPFEAMIQKYGIPNKSWPQCTRELKRRPIESYIRSIGWTDYLTAIGIRADEPARLRENSASDGHVYPLATDFTTTKAEINDWWENQPFNLRLKEHRGNCIWCWKKSLPKLLRIANETPNAFDFPARMERLYTNVGPEDNPNRVFFREYRSTAQIMEMATLVTLPPLFDNQDENSGCSESCEAFA